MLTFLAGDERSLICVLSEQLMKMYYHSEENVSYTLSCDLSLETVLFSFQMEKGNDEKVLISVSRNGLDTNRSVLLFAAM